MTSWMRNTITNLYNRLRNILGYRKIEKQELLCNALVSEIPWMLKYVPDQYKDQEMCNNAVAKELWLLFYVPDKYMSQEMRNVEFLNAVLNAVLSDP